MRKKLRVLLLAPIAHSFPPQGYGPWELVCYNLAESLYKLGMDVTVFTTKSAKTDAKKMWYWDNPAEEGDHSSYAKNLVHIAQAIKKSHGFDIVHNHLNIEPALFAKHIDTPMVTTLHGAGCEPKNKPLHEYLKNENFISISFAERKFAPYLKYVGNVYNGVDFDRYKLSKGGGEYLLFSGRISKQKGIEDSIALSKKTGIPLKITGIITDKKYFIDKVKPHLSENIEYLGNLEYKKYSSVIRNAKVLTFFIHWNEPFGLSAIDALAAGVPVIGYNRGALPEILYDRQMGFLVNTVSEAEKKIKDIEELDPKKIRDLAFQKFSREKMTEGYLSVYEKIAFA